MWMCAPSWPANCACWRRTCPVRSSRLLLHPDFTEVDPAGRRWARADLISALATAADRETTPRTASGLQGVRLSGSTIIVTYVSEQGDRRAQRVTLWLRAGPSWRAYFHQSTPDPCPANRRGAGAGYAPGGGRAGRQPFRRDGLTAALAVAVGACVQAGQRLVDRGQVVPGLGQQGGHVLAFEGDGRALRVVLVVGVVGLRRGHDLAELPFQPGHLLQRGLPLRRQGHAYPGRLRLFSRRRPAPVPAFISPAYHRVG